MVATISPAWGVCAPWTTDADFTDGANVICAAPSARVQLIASELLYVMTARQWPGACTRSVRPYVAPAADPGPVRTSVDPIPQSIWYAGTFPGGGYLLQDRRLQLVGYPITSITQVLVDGAVLPQSAYHVEDWTYLCRDDGLLWPSWQDTRLPPTQVGTFEVAYGFGTAPPVSGVFASASLACEIDKAISGDSTCRFPKRVQVIARQGVTAAVLDPMIFVTEGRTAILEVDMFINAANPGGLTEAPAIITPDTMHSPTRRTWTT